MNKKESWSEYIHIRNINRMMAANKGFVGRGSNCVVKLHESPADRNKRHRINKEKLRSTKTRHEVQG